MPLGIFNLSQKVVCQRQIMIHSLLAINVQIQFYLPRCQITTSACPAILRQLFIIDSINSPTPPCHHLYIFGITVYNIIHVSSSNLEISGNLQYIMLEPKLHIARPISLTSYTSRLTSSRYVLKYTVIIFKSQTLRVNSYKFLNILPPLNRCL